MLKATRWQNICCKKLKWRFQTLGTLALLVETVSCIYFMTSDRRFAEPIKQLPSGWVVLACSLEDRISDMGQKSQGRPLGRAFAFPGMTKLPVSRKPWYSAQTSHQPPAITTQIETSLILNTQQIGYPVGWHRCRGPSRVWPQHCPLYISPVPVPVRTGESPFSSSSSCPWDTLPDGLSHSESVPLNPQLGPEWSWPHSRCSNHVSSSTTFGSIT